MIYLIEDDASIRELVVYTLNGQGLDTKGFESPAEFWKAMEKRMPDLVLLDIMLPDEDGLHILKRLRSSAATKQLSVMMLTAKGTEYDKVIGLDSGADDYLPKPFGMMELIARVRALLRRGAGKENEPEYINGDLRVCPSKHIVQVEGKNIDLTLKEFEMLCLLIENQGVVFNRAQLIDRIWGYEFDGETRTVDVHIRTLRQKLGSCGHLIQTVRGIGYKIGDEGL